MVLQVLLIRRIKTSIITKMETPNKESHRLGMERVKESISAFFMVRRVTRKWNAPST